MKKIVLVYDQENLMDYYKILVQGLFDYDVLCWSSSEETMELLSSNPEEFCLILADYSTPQSDKLIRLVLGLKKAMPLIITGEPEQIQKAKKSFKTQTLLDYFIHFEDVEKIQIKLRKLVSFGSRKNTLKKYCKVNLSFFYSTNEVFCDVYLKLSDNKFVKIFNRYDQIDFGDLRKFETRNIRYLYVRERDFGLITKRLVENLKPIFEDEEQLPLAQNKNLSLVFSIQLQETVSETIKTIGLSSEAVQMTNYAINSTMGLLEKEEEVFEFFKNSIFGQNYASEHSFLLSFLSCALLRESPYSNDIGFLALTVASFFHDVTIESGDNAKIQTTHEYRFKTLGIDEQKDFLNHPVEAKDLIEKIDGVPREASTIIYQHHELYNGGGFPEGIDYKRISPLSSLFNIAHELVVYLYDSKGSRENLEAILHEMTELYPLGNYAMAVKAAQKVFSKDNRLKKAS